MKYTDLVFGNETEAEAFAHANGLDKDASIEEIARAIASLPSHKDTKRTVIITQGADCTIVCHGDSINRYKVKKVSNVIDTTGAGDSFCGGFLSQLVLGYDEATCVEAGHYAASVVIQAEGAVYPQQCQYSNSHSS
jgi:adenosine kinase